MCPNHHGDGSATLWLDGPEKHNLLTLQDRDQVEEVIRGPCRGWKDPSGSDPERRWKCVQRGGRIQEFIEHPPHTFQNPGKNLSTPTRFPGIIIAAIHGYCFGAGLELVLFCGLWIATRRSLLGQSEMDIGSIPGSGGTRRLLRYVDLTWTMEHCLLGRRPDAETAEQWDVLNDDRPDEENGDFVGALQSGPPVGQKTVKKEPLAGLDASLAWALDLGRHAFSMRCSTGKTTEGIQRFWKNENPSSRASRDQAPE